jgi:hypothetical protein
VALSQKRLENFFLLQDKYSKSLSLAENLKFPPKTVYNLFKFSAQDSDLEYLFWRGKSSPISSDLTPNTPLIHTWFTYSIWNMGEFCGLKFHLIYVHTTQIFLLKSIHAQKVSFLLLNLHF